MARNQEKAQSMLNRYLQGKQDEERGPKQRRPYLASECDDLNDADKWRHQILREVGKKVMEIQNAGLGEHRLRDLNDEINKLIREKSHWERRILELGGPDYARTAPRVADSEGRAIAEATGRGPGYRYFGAAKNLPGVRELFDKEAPRHVRRTRGEMHRHIDGDYYGFRDEEDGALEPVEAAAEAEMRAAALAEWREKDAERAAALGAAVAGAIPSEEEEAPRFVAYVPLPDQKQIEQRVLESKKKAILDKYASAQEQKAQEDSRVLLNR